MLVRRRFHIVALCVTLSFIAVCPALSRQWKTTPRAMAIDYTQIQDVRAQGDLVVIIWFAPHTVAPDSSGAPALTATLEKYVVIMAVRAHMNQTTGTMSVDETNTLEARDGSGKPLTLVDRDALPPVTTGVLASAETVFRQSLGPLGKGMKMFAFDAGAVRSCEKGELSVPFAGETYTWETPIPGCSAK